MGVPLLKISTSITKIVSIVPGRQFTVVVVVVVVVVIAVLNKIIGS
jgi:hypothetical protein